MAKRSVSNQQVYDLVCELVSCRKPFKSIKKKQKYCNEICSGLARRKKIRPDKEQLAEDVEKLGWSGCGKKYGVNPTTIKFWAKCCGVIPDDRV